MSGGGDFELARSRMGLYLHILVGIGILERERRTDSRADVARAEGLDGEVWVDLADDLGGIAVGEVRVLEDAVSKGILAINLDHRWTYAVEENGDDSLGVNGGLVAAQLRDFADDGDGAADEAVEVGGGDAGGGHLLSHGW